MQAGERARQAFALAPKKAPKSRFGSFMACRRTYVSQRNHQYLLKFFW
jgi:hypothetical protein